MRDIILTLIFVGLLPLILRNAVIGVYGWVWISMMNPHRATYGFAANMPFAQSVAITTMLAFIFSKHRRPLPINAITMVLVCMLIWMGVTSFFAIAPTDKVIERFIFVMKTQVMVLVTLMLVRGRQDIDRLIWVILFSIGFYGVKGGFFTLATGGGARVWGPAGSLLEGNNELAVALVMIFPLTAYLHQAVQRRWLKVTLASCMVLCGFAILGTQSRGALLSLVAMAAFLGIKSKRPVASLVAITCAILLALAFMPESWSKRMDTIQTYQEDESAMTRIYTWKTLFNCAVDRPLLGAGFGADTPEVFARYAPRSAEFSSFGDVVLVAHSIYFQMLGEHGFVGLLLFLMLGITTWIKASSLARKCVGIPEFANWVPMLMRMVQVGLIGFGVGGAFLSLAYLDVPFYVISIVVVVDATVKDFERDFKARRSAAGIREGDAIES